MNFLHYLFAVVLGTSVALSHASEVELNDLQFVEMHTYCKYSAYDVVARSSNADDVNSAKEILLIFDIDGGIHDRFVSIFQNNDSQKIKENIQGGLLASEHDQNSNINDFQNTYKTCIEFVVNNTPENY